AAGAAQGPRLRLSEFIRVYLRLHFALSSTFGTARWRCPQVVAAVGAVADAVAPDLAALAYQPDTGSDRADTDDQPIGEGQRDGVDLNAPCGVNDGGILKGAQAKPDAPVCLF